MPSLLAIAALDLVLHFALKRSGASPIHPGMPDDALLSSPPAVFSDGTPITLDALLVKANHLTPMPAVVIKLLDLMGDPRSSAERVTRIVERDQAISAAVVKLSNSALHRARSPITNLQMAVTRVGLSGVRDLVVAASVLRTPTGSIAVVEKVRRRMFAAGCFARVIGTSIPRISADTCFMTAMLLDVGRFLIGLAEPDVYADLMAETDTTASAISHAEEKWLGFSHAEVGTALAKGWGFPDSIAKFIRWQNDWEGAQAALSPEETWYLAACILADDIAGAREAGRTLTPDEIRAHPVASSIRIPDDEIETLMARCEETMEQLSSVFDL